MTIKEVEEFEKTQAQLEGLYVEIAILAKKIPNDSVNNFKLAFINEIIEECNGILGDRYKPLKSFEQFNSDDLPSNSDVTFILSQYLNCFEKLRTNNIHDTDYPIKWYWTIDSEESYIETKPPKKLQ